MIEDYFENFVRLEEQANADGYGGTDVDLASGEAFRGGLSTASSAEILVAEKSAERITHNLAVIGVALERNERIRRVSDGRIFRVASNASDMTVPSLGCVAFSQVRLEAIES